jgi:hypothetical protein
MHDTPLPASQWDLMSKMEAMSGQPVDMSYRGIGSSGGLTEFLVSRALPLPALH